MGNIYGYCPHSHYLASYSSHNLYGDYSHSNLKLSYVLHGISLLVMDILPMFCLAMEKTGSHDRHGRRSPA